MTGYEPLERVLSLALAQAASGKGRARHGNGRPFGGQPGMMITRTVGTGFPVGQAVKKLYEASGMFDRGETAAAKAELLGAIIYAAMAYMMIEERE